MCVCVFVGEMGGSMCNKKIMNKQHKNTNEICTKRLNGDPLRFSSATTQASPSRRDRHTQQQQMALSRSSVVRVGVCVCSAETLDGGGYTVRRYRDGLVGGGEQEITAAAKYRTEGSAAHHSSSYSICCNTLPSGTD